MSFIRPEALATLNRWRELLFSVAFGGVAIWVALRGGLFYGTIGVLLLGLAAGLGLTAWRRMRFRAADVAPGIVHYDEGAIAYFGPHTGGVIALSEISRIDAVATPDGLAWRISQDSGGPVEIPVGAQGAERLFDTFAALPGARSATFLRALEHPPKGVQRMWQRTGPPASSRLPRP